MSQQDYDNISHAREATRKLQDVVGTAKCVIAHTSSANVARLAIEVEVLARHAFEAAQELDVACVNEENKG